MFDLRARNVRWASLMSATVALSFLLIPSPVSAQQAPEVGFERRFAVGGGLLLGRVVCLECDEPETSGAAGGFEVRFNDDWSVIAEGAWADGYDVYGLTREPVGLRHDYFAFLTAKLRWQFTDLRHRPYLAFGGTAVWDHDTSYQWRYFTGGRTTQIDRSRVVVRETLRAGGGAVVGFGWAFKLGDRLEVRPEADLYMTRFGSNGSGASFVQLGIGGWFSF